VPGLRLFCTSDVRFAANTDRESEILQKVMSATPLKADITAMI
jgi:hypothetical protein